jgi:hypothetical protein
VEERLKREYGENYPKCFQGVSYVEDKTGQRVPARMGRYGKPVLCYQTFKQCEECQEYNIYPTGNGDVSEDVRTVLCDFPGRDKER